MEGRAGHSGEEGPDAEWDLEEEVEELKLKVCRCARVEEEIDTPEEVKV